LPIQKLASIFSMFERYRERPFYGVINSNVRTVAGCDRFHPRNTRT
jgi:hypothetical protein